MNYLLFQFNKFRDNPWLVFWTACGVLILAGFLVMQINLCRVTSYIYQGYQLTGTPKPSLFCRIF